MEKMFQCIMVMRLRPHIREGREGQTGIFLKCFEVQHPDEFLMFCIKVLVRFVNLAGEMQKDELVESSSDQQAPDLSDKSTRIVSEKHQKHHQRSSQTCWHHGQHQSHDNLRANRF